MPSKRTNAYAVALGGILGALAVVVMCLGTLIPVATYVCPMLCILLLQAVRKLCGTRMAWAWYGAVTFLGLLMAPDKEAAAVFAALGYYPILKPKFDKTRLPWLWKGIFFNSVILALYWLLMHLFGLDQIVREFKTLGAVMTAVTLVLGNVVFFLLDRILGRRIVRRKKG